MKLTLIIPDIHLKCELADRIIYSVGADEIIFLGDYFDNYGDDPTSVGNTCDWLCKSVTFPNRIHLFGNHDMHYAFASKYFQCSGYEQWKYFYINDRVPRNVWDKLKYYHVLDDTWLLSHAGIHNKYIQNMKFKTQKEFLQKISNMLDSEIVQGHRNNSWIFHSGFGRGGNQYAGGITWCDYELEFEPTVGLNQILGHTPVPPTDRWKVIHNGKLIENVPTDEIDYKDITKSYNLDLDSRGNFHWATWDGKNIKIYNRIEHL